MAVNARLLAVTVLMTALTGAVVWCPVGAQAAVMGRDGDSAEFEEVVIGKRNSQRYGGAWMRNGNGKFNRSYSSSHSNTDQRGVQHVANNNISGLTSTQIGLCKRKNVCKIRQKFRLPHH